ncbi:preprotein translocase subunit SecA [Candidatus Babeliales bacterium]|nr:preprotein translocase subunit SecA [Candidatus Babeliales bacterium]
MIGTANARQLKKLQPTIDTINALEPEINGLSDDQLKIKTVEFRERLKGGATLDDLLPEAYAVVREASKRVLGLRHFDEQLMGGIVLHQGKIAEMKTGEGKTLTATLPLYLNALSGKGAHLVTVNDYLARRDARREGQIYTFLGLTVGIIQHGLTDVERKTAYNCDVVYGTNSEFGFDYLRDNMKFRLTDYVQRDLNYVIIDEVDSILIDEARTPLIISGPTDEGSKLYLLADKVVRRLREKDDYEIDIKDRNVQLTEAGVDKIESAFSIKNLYAVEHLNILHHIQQALRAHAIFKLDVDYVVRDNQVLIVDEFTGRILPGRRYSDGLHQALEAKEGVKIERESQTLASITLQNFFRMYKKLSGMTGTAATEAEEFHNIYKLDVVSVPTHELMIRDDKDDLIFLTKNAKYKAIVQDIQERHAKGQPVLIGTVAIETSEFISQVLSMSGLPHEVLNAKQHAREAEIIECAGEPGRVTIATNMAGRGTDIKLTPTSKAAGGLYILGTERHESRRIDNQLRGRSGRQGDPGESRFYISLEDDLIRRFGGDLMQRRMTMAGMTEDEVIESRMISKMIENAQEKVEKDNFDKRKNTLEYDDVLNQQRKVVYQFRRDILDGEEHIFDLVRDMIIGTVQDILLRIAPKRSLQPEQVTEAFDVMSKLTGLPVEEFRNAGLNTANTDTLKTGLVEFLVNKYQMYRTQSDAPALKEAEKWLMLETLDHAWKQHMLNLDSLRDGIGLRGVGQKNPLIEYKLEAFDMFKEIMEQIRFDVVHHIFHLNLERFNSHDIEQKRERELEALNFISSGDSTTGDESSKTYARGEDKIGRNDPCPCGSGKKYKKCCMK